MVTDCFGADESCTVTSRLLFFAVPVDGVPVIAPVDAFNVSPAGSSGTDHTIGGTPPALCKLALYASPSVPSGNELVVIDNGVLGKLMVKSIGGLELVWCAGMVESVTVNVCVVVPLLPASGTPLITPDDALRVSPFGSAGLTPQEYGAVPPVALSWVFG